MFFCIVQLLFPWLRPESGRPDACSLELINTCMHLFVGRENDCSGSNIPQNRVFQDATFGSLE